MAKASGKGKKSGKLTAAGKSHGKKIRPGNGSAGKVTAKQYETYNPTEERFQFFQMRKPRPWGRSFQLDTTMATSFVCAKKKTPGKTIIPQSKQPFLMRNLYAGQRHLAFYRSMMGDFTQRQNQPELPDQLVNGDPAALAIAYPSMESVFALKQLQEMMPTNPVISQLDLAFVDDLAELQPSQISPGLGELLNQWVRVCHECSKEELEVDKEINSVDLWNETVRKAQKERDQLISQMG